MRNLKISAIECNFMVEIWRVDVVAVRRMAIFEALLVSLRWLFVHLLASLLTFLTIKFLARKILTDSTEAGLPPYLSNFSCSCNHPLLSHLIMVFFCKQQFSIQFIHFIVALNANSIKIYLTCRMSSLFDARWKDNYFILGICSELLLFSSFLFIYIDMRIMSQQMRKMNFQ